MQKPGAGDLSEYRIFETREFQRQLEKLPPPVRDSLREKLTDYTYPHLRQQPYFGTNIRKLAATRPILGDTGSGATAYFTLWTGKSGSFPY